VDLPLGHYRQNAGPATIYIRGRIYPPKLRSGPSFMSSGRSVRTRFPLSSTIPSSFSSHGRADALRGSFQTRFVLWMLQRCSQDRGHFIYESGATRTMRLPLFQSVLKRRWSSRTPGIRAYRSRSYTWPIIRTCPLNSGIRQKVIESTVTNREHLSTPSRNVLISAK
jgi:hypothetical protein